MEHLLTLLVLSLFHLNGHVCVEIIGGKEAVPHSRPYMAYTGPKNICGGALIKPNWILTAAHCNVDYGTYAILGAHSQKNTDEQQKLRVKQGIKHPCFDKVLKINDIQLLKLEKPAKLSKFVAVIPLPKSEQTIAAKTMCSVAGWGLTNPKGNSPSDVLREANLTIIDNDDCQKRYSVIKKPQPITKSMICGGPLKKRKDHTCMGDSGGPLICNNTYAGIVSFGFGICGSSKFPDVYTRLTDEYLKWIRDTIDGDNSAPYTV